MNWFERYGIVGMFSIIMTGMWFFCLFPDSYTLLSQTDSNEVLVKYIAGFCGLGFLPIGYLIVIFGQFLYYRISLWEKIHCKYWQELPNGIKEFIEVEEKKNGGAGLSEEDKKDEAKIEAIITYYDRMGTITVENNKFLSRFATKRYDVIAINRGLLLAIPISMFCAVCMKIVILNITLMELLKSFGYINFSFYLAVVVSIIIWLILRNSNSILEQQIIETGKRKLKCLLKEPEKKNLGKQT